MFGLDVELTFLRESSFHDRFFEDKGWSLQVLLLFFFLPQINDLTVALPVF